MSGITQLCASGCLLFAKTPVFNWQLPSLAWKNNSRDGLAQIRKAATPQARIVAYERLKETLALFLDLQVLGYNAAAEHIFHEQRKAGIRIGSLDLRIAAIAIAHNGVLLTRNRRDFEKVSGLSLQDWSI
jgi:tRNA(fMet)-specific endonuclease VapC